MGYQVEPSPESFRKVLFMAKEAGPGLRRNLGKAIKVAAEPAAQAARDKVSSELPPKADQRSGLRRRILGSKFGNNHGHTGLRAAIARGVTISVRSSAKTAGVRIQSSGKYLRPNQKNMNRTYNQETFRHPVFGRGSVPQHGNPWFREPIMARRPQIQAAVVRALQDTADELGKL